MTSLFYILSFIHAANIHLIFLIWWVYDAAFWRMWNEERIA